MFLKLTITACCLASAIAVTYGPIQGQVSPKYPAGIDPNTCPNFPYCSNPLVTVSQGIKVNTEEEKEESPEYEYTSPYEVAPAKTPQYEVYPVRQAPTRYAPPGYQIKLIGPGALPHHPITPLRLTVPFNPFQTPQFKFTPAHQVATKLQLGPNREKTPQYLVKQYQGGQPQLFYPQVSTVYKPKYTETPKPQQHQYRVSEEQPYQSGYEDEYSHENQRKMEKELEEGLRPYASAFENGYSPEQQMALDRGEYIGDGDYHGEGLEEGYGDEDEE